MNLRSLSNRVLVSHARPDAYVDKTRVILGRLGYRILDVNDYVRMGECGSEAPPTPDAWIVDEHRLPELEAGNQRPIILLTGRRGSQSHGDSRVVGAIKRPVGLHDLYRLTQQVFEDTPRSIPRVPAALVARCEREGKSWSAELVSISENGGLLRCDEKVPLGACFDLSFELPRTGPISLRAEAAYQLLPDTGVVFSGLPPAAREAICAYVNDTLLA
jgi:hypothetical protein